MQLGVAVPQAGSWATPDHMVTVARRAEDLGYHSLWTFQRLLYPADPEQADEPKRWPPVYRSVHDPLVTLAFLAGQTSRVRLGVAVLNMPWYSPPLLAKEATTLDVVSGGRLDLGLGLGWAAEEYAATGAPGQRRGARGEEFVRALQALWLAAGEPVDFAGEFHRISGVRLHPLPVQRPHPPILLGGSADRALRRAGRVADGWISSSGFDLSSLPPAIDTVRQAAAEAGRDPAALLIVTRGVVRVRPPGAEQRRLLSGSWDEIRADLARLAEVGVTEAFLDLNFDHQVGHPDADPSASMDRALEMLETLAP